MGFFSNLTGGSSEEEYINKLAIIENQINNNDDFYGCWLEDSRAKLIADDRLSIPNVILGLIYFRGIHVIEDHSKAESYFKRSIELGTPFAYKYLWLIEIQRGNKEKGEIYWGQSPNYMMSKIYEEVYGATKEVVGVVN